MKNIFLMINILFSFNSFAFDLDDYRMTHEQTSAAYRKAYNEYYLIRESYTQLFALYSPYLPLRDASQFQTTGNKLFTCTYMEACGKARTGAIVIPKISSLVAKPLLRSYLSGAELDTLKADVETYYSKFDPSIDTASNILLVDQPDIVTLELYDDNGQYTFYGSPTPGPDDPEDLLTTYRATRDAYLKAKNELKLATAPAHAARAGYAAAYQAYMNNSNCANWGPTKTPEDLLKLGLGAP